MEEHEEKPLIILGSARKQSDTKKLVDIVFAGTDHHIIDLLDYTVDPYNYTNEYTAGDQFFTIIGNVLNYKNIIFATPIYWYAMSGLMKTFFDRFSDLVTAQKQTGRQLKGKSIFLLTIGADKLLPDGFEVPFKSTAEYLNMVYQSCLYCATDDLEPGRDLATIIQPFRDKFCPPI